MKMHNALIKQLLKYCEKNAPGPRGFLFHPDIDGFSTEQVEYHVRLCSQAGFLLLNQTGHMIELTYDGQIELRRLQNVE